MPTYIKDGGDFYKLSDPDVESAEVVDGDVRLAIREFDNSAIYLSEEDLLHLLKLIEETN